MSRSISAIRMWKNQTAIRSMKLAIEVDGKSHDGGIFCSKEEKQADDNLKDQQIKSLGWRIMRFRNEEIEKNLDGVCNRIIAIIESN